MEPDTLPYCGGAPLPADLMARWNLDPVLMVLLAAAFLLCFRARVRSGPLVGALAVLVLVFVSPLCALASALFSARTVHHVLLIAVAAPLIALSLSRQSQGRRGALAGWTLTHAVVLWAWHSPAAYAFALESYWGYALMQVTLLGTATGFWRTALASPVPAAVTALLATMMQMGLLGALLTFSGTAIYRWHWITTQAWGLSPLEDQQLAGLVMWVPGAGAYLFAALLVAGRWLASQESGRERALAT